MNKIIGIGILVGFLIAFGGMSFADDIHEFAQKGDLEGVKALIDKNPELVNAKDKDGRTPLHWACRGVHLDVVEFLVDKGADVKAEDNNKIVPLHSLATRNNAAAIEVLTAKGANVDAKDYGGNTALHGNPCKQRRGYRNYRGIRPHAAYFGCKRKGRTKNDKNSSGCRC